MRCAQPTHLVAWQPHMAAPHACRYGNTSSSTVWYSFGFVESVQGVKKGDVVWQVGGGGGGG